MVNSTNHSRGALLRGLSLCSLLLVIVLVGGCLRTQRLSEIAYWFDESFCVKMAEFSVPEIWERAGRDTHPPLFFWLLKLWGMAFGTSPAALRLLSGTLGLATVVGMFLFVREAYLPRAGDPRGSAAAANLAALTAAALVALSPFQIAWSVQVRMYALGSALTAFSSWLLMRALRREPGGPADWIGYTLTAALLAYTHYFGLFTLAAQWLFAAGYLWFDPRPGAAASRAARLIPLALSVWGVAFVWQFWLPTFAAQRERVIASFWTKPPTWESAGDLFLQIFGPYQTPFGKTPGSTLAGLAIAQGSILVLLGLLLGRRPADRYVALGASLPFVAALLVSLGPRSIWVARYFQFAHLFLLGAAGVLVCRVPWRGLRWAGVLLLAGGMGTLSWLHYQRREELAQHPGMQAALRKLDDLRRPGELLVICNPMLHTTVAAYTEDRAGVYTYDRGHGYPMFQGAAVMRESEYVTREGLQESTAAAVWTLDADRWLGGRWAAPMPRGWRRAAEMRYREYYCELVIRLYVREEDAGVAAVNSTNTSRRNLHPAK